MSVSVVTGLCGTPKFDWAKNTVAIVQNSAVINIDHFTHGEGWKKRSLEEVKSSTITAVERVLASGAQTVVVVGSWHDPTDPEDRRVNTFRAIIEKFDADVTVLAIPSLEKQSQLIRERAFRRETGQEATWGPNSESGTGEMLVEKQAKFRDVMVAKLEDLLRTTPNAQVAEWY